MQNSSYLNFRGWVDRENQRELKPGNIWYLVSTQWWRSWKEYVSYQVCCQNSSISGKLLLYCLNVYCMRTIVVV